MSLISQTTIFTNPNHHFKILNLSLQKYQRINIFRPPSPSSKTPSSLKTNHLPPKAFVSDKSMHEDDHYTFNFDVFLSIAEALCLGSSAIVSIGIAANCVVSETRNVINSVLVNRIVPYQVVLLVFGIAIGALIRRRQWRRMCRKDGSVNFVGRIEKLEEDIQNSASIIRALSRQLEKLGIRFRVTRKSLKEPIAETAALAQKNSEATRALAVQEDNLERELGEIQKVLLAMQEQQQKQLELILVIAKAGKLYDNRGQPSKGENAARPYKSAEELVIRKEPPLVQTAIRHQEINNDLA